MAIRSRAPLSQSRKKAILEGVQKRRRQRTIITIVVVAVLIAIIVGGIWAVTMPRNENQQVIPPNVGISGGCMRTVHTHDGSGQIHVEPLVDRDIAVGDFFLVWGKVLNSSGIFRTSQQLPSYLGCLSGATPAYHDHHTLTIIFRRDAPSTITMTVNGTPESLLQNYVFPRNPDAANIVITYGPGVPAEF